MDIYTFYILYDPILLDLDVHFQFQMISITLTIAKDQIQNLYKI